MWCRSSCARFSSSCVRIWLMSGARLALLSRSSCAPVRALPVFELFCSVLQFIPFCKGLQYSCKTEIGFPIGFLFMPKSMKRKPTVFRRFSDGFPRQEGYCSVKVGFPSVFRRVYLGPKPNGYILPNCMCHFFLELEYSNYIFI